MKTFTQFCEEVEKEESLPPKTIVKHAKTGVMGKVIKVERSDSGTFKHTVRWETGIESEHGRGDLLTKDDEDKLIDKEGDDD